MASRPERGRNKARRSADEATLRRRDIDPRLIPFRDALAEMLVDWALEQPEIRERLEAARKVG